ncbi:MAG: sugar phosphate isomerase/epimerase family protein [Flavobacteriales bacterium]
MIYVSSSCVKNQKIKDSVSMLREAGINEVELSGGTQPYSELEADLLEAKKQGVNFLIHNYFPPPPIPFVLNLASVNTQTRNASIEHCKRSIDLSRNLNATKYGIHAGFFLDVGVHELGKKITADKLVEEEKATHLFCEAFEELKEFAGEDVKLYVENNVFSKANSESFGGVNPFMLTHKKAFEELSNILDFNLLLDVAHLKVSCGSLGLDFEDELTQLFPLSDYIHLSDNDGLSDSNRPIEEDSALLKQLGDLNWEGKTVTLEVYSELGLVKSSKENVKKLINA